MMNQLMQLLARGGRMNQPGGMGQPMGMPQGGGMGMPQGGGMGMGQMNPGLMQLLEMMKKRRAMQGGMGMQRPQMGGMPPQAQGAPMGGPMMQPQKQMAPTMGPAMAMKGQY